MKNLKKVLSLVMAVAMMVSICVVGASAVNYDDFSDKGEITKAQAVETLVSLDILNGYNGGETFAPTQPVTRAEMATIICRVLAGGESLIPDATKEVPTYTDIKGNWAESYIEYCTSLGIVSGKGATFEPNANVTAAEAAKMVMTMLGYNADIEGFKGMGWDINSMAKANTLRLTANLVTEISAGKALTREQVAQLVYNALTTPVVQNYVGIEANTWIASGKDAYQETLLETKFNAKKLTGVVIANEHADLYGAKGIKKGTTELALMDDDGDLTGDTKILNVSTEIMDLGSSIVVYWNETTKKVVYGDFQDTGLNVITEYTAEGKVEEKAAERFINYAIGEVATSEYRISYQLEGEDRVSFRPGAAIDVDTIKSIFDEAGKDDEMVFGEVYVGTQYNEDVSDKMSFTKFVNEYLDFDVDNELVSKNENGNYVKTVDFNNDGDVDFAFKITFTMAEVTDVARNGDLTITGINDETDDDATNDDNVDKIVCEDDVAEGDVVVYTIIDRVAYVQLADSFEGTVKKVSYRNETFTTTAGDEYEWSGIADLTEYAVDELDDLDDVDYIFYTDLFGYVRIAAEPDLAASDYILITEIYRNRISGNNQLISSKEVIAEVVDAEGEAAEYPLANAFGRNDVPNEFYDPTEGPRGALVPFDFEDDEQNAWTNVGAYAINDDDQITLKDVLKQNTDKKTGEKYTVVDYVDVVNDDITKGQKHFDIVDGTDEDDYINVTQDTLVYYVLNNDKDDEIEKVWTSVGYSSIPATDAETQIHEVYAVCARTSTDSNQNYFGTAKVLVIELEKDYSKNTNAIVFGYSNPSKETARVFELDALDMNGEKVTLDMHTQIFSDAQYRDACLVFSDVTLKEKDSTEVIDIDEVTNFHEEGICAATIDRVSDKMDYIDLKHIDGVTGNSDAVYLARGAKIYHLDYVKGTYVIDAVAYTDEEIADDELAGHDIIYVLDEKHEKIVYAIDVTGSLNERDGGAAKAELVALWEDITGSETRTATFEAKDPATFDKETMTLTVPHTVDLDEATMSTIDTYLTVNPDGGWMIAEGDEVTYDADKAEVTVTLAGLNGADDTVYTIKVENAIFTAEYLVTYWVGSTSGNVQIAVAAANGPKQEYLTVAELMELGLTKNDFTITLNGTEYSAEQILRYDVVGNDGSAMAGKAFIKVAFGSDVFTAGQYLNAEGQTDNITFELDVANLNDTNMNGVINTGA